MSRFDSFDDDEGKKPKLRRDSKGFMRQEGLRYEFDCPECDANNPHDEGFADGAEIVCHYCGTEFRVTFLEGNKLRIKAV